MNIADPSLNPYASPKADVGRVKAPAEPWLGTYKAVTMPRDLMDCIIGGSFGVSFASLLYGIPLGALWFVHAPAGAYLLSVVLVLMIGIVALAVGVRKVEFDDRGIVARRMVLPSFRMSWDQVDRMRMAGRAEVLWSTAFKPHRCCSYSLTSAGQVAIYGRRFKLIFPPENLGGFCATVSEMASANNPNFRDERVGH